jgi:hypothetical protein
MCGEVEMTEDEEEQKVNRQFSIPGESMNENDIRNF